ncbi:FAD-dependent oxidoreductase [Hyphomicrobium sp. LHD-15]|uniref:NAD(P)/FAD-dependent oxidoreductase n=1 Tax=Hyphomicrobium sp. LHD-15 TaxID=3072142 RepID=UPI00280D5572|nr:FAD-dependent oxidoreductase [Hyphomicrobium sp. LHD-15]MDQ8699556.1 FAD-dependent oxidoreductase [Hyphomicrobium sp. LHD-15]
MSEPLVIVGNGMAATRLVDELTTLVPGRYAIAVVGEEPSLAYNRVLLSSLLAREIDEDAVTLKKAEWWRDRGVTLVYGRRAVEIDTKAKAVRLRGGSKLNYSKLVLAIGSEAVRLPLPGADLPGVVTFRDKSDVEAILSRARTGARAVVIGGGLLGLEAAYGLMKAGAEVSVVHLMDRLMERQLDCEAAGLLKAALEERGIQVVLNAESEAVQGRRKVAGLRLKDGRNIPADLIVMAVGIRPNVRLARGADLSVNRGIVVGDDLATSDPDVYALGECAEHRGTCYGLVEPAYEQARTLARALAGKPASYEGSLLSTNLKVSGVNVFSAGDFLGAPGTEPIVLRDPGRKSYRKLVVNEDRLTGAVLVGDTADALWYLDLIRSGAPIGALREDLVFGRAFAEPQACAA